MFIVVKACFLVGLICFSFCEALVGLLPGILDPIINPSGPKPLVPIINITLEIELPQHKCCPPCNPPATCKPCPTCSPVTTCKPCPTQITCPTCPPPITCATCPVCTPPPTCPTCETCPTPTACPTTASTCPPDNEKICSDANAIYCAKANLCITTVFSPRTYILAVDKCRSLSTSVIFDLLDQRAVFNVEDAANCVKRIIPTMLVDDESEALWDRGSFGVTNVAKYTVVEDKIVGIKSTNPFSRDSLFPFYCIAIL